MRVEEVKLPDGRVVGQEIVSASFEEWIEYVFDHQPEDRNWWSADNCPDWSVNTAETVECLRRTFEESGSVLTKFNDHQVASGIWYIANSSAAVQGLLDETVPLDVRISAIVALRKLYVDCFETRCSSLLSHLNETEVDSLNVACYMWWDVLPIVGQPEQEKSKEIDKACLGIMELALGLKSDACRESALHGLGHWANYYRDRVQSIVDQFLKTNPHARPELLEYARRAREGSVQ
jgi:hypothetical protein